MAEQWDPDQYLKFADARLRPALDLLQQVHLAAPGQVYDLGCGTGHLTRLLAERWPHAQVTGVDASAAMLASAARATGGAVAVRWLCEDLASWRPSVPADLVFSNAALHWLPEHAELLPRLVAGLAPHGCLAIQMPRNFAAASHTLIAETARAGRWRARLGPLLRPAPVETPAWYYELLAPHVASLTIWETEYLQALSGADPVKEWVKGTWLKPLLDALEAPESAAFEAEYAARVRVAYPPLASGVTLFPFKRLFLVVRAP